MSKMCHFLTGPYGVLNTAIAESPLGAQTGPHHVRFVREPLLQTRRETQSCIFESYTLPSIFPTVYFSTVAPGPLSGDLTFNSLAQLQVAHHKGLLRVCEIFHHRSLAEKIQGKETFFKPPEQLKKRSAKLTQRPLQSDDCSYPLLFP